MLRIVKNTLAVSPVSLNKYVKTVGEHATCCCDARPLCLSCKKCMKQTHNEEIVPGV